jgi:hypothetical protein
MFVPECIFTLKIGYRGLEAFKRYGPRLEKRKPVVFWRGATTGPERPTELHTAERTGPARPARVSTWSAKP